jgi:hypothetical protein
MRQVRDYEDRSHSIPPHYAYPLSVSNRVARVQWDFLDFVGKPAGVSVIGRYPIKEFRINIIVPPGTRLGLCDECVFYLDGLEVVGVSKEVLRERCSVISDGLQIACSNILVPAERPINYWFGVEGWGECQ